MRQKFKQVALVVCLFLFVLVVLGGGLHLRPAGALLAAATGTPLIIHVLNRWRRDSFGDGSTTTNETSVDRSLTSNARPCSRFRD